MFIYNYNIHGQRHYTPWDAESPGPCGPGDFSIGFCYILRLFHDYLAYGLANLDNVNALTGRNDGPGNAANGVDKFAIDGVDFDVTALGSENHDAAALDANFDAPQDTVDTGSLELHLSHIGGG